MSTQAPPAVEQATLDTSTEPPLLALEGLKFAYDTRSVLDDMSLHVEPGQLVGLLGPNGSGKSTAFAILAGLLQRAGGSIAYRGRPLENADKAFRKELGVVFQSPSIDTRLSCQENLELAAAMQGFRGAVGRQRAADWLERIGLKERARDVAGELSGGMRRQLDIARALIGDARLLLMDEPTSGLDERAFRATWDRLDLMRRELGLTILTTTHRPEEAERCDHIAVLHEGRIVAKGTPDELKRKVAKDIVIIQTEAPADIAAELETAFGLTALLDDGQVLVESDEGHTLVPRLVERFPAGSLQAISLRRPSLGDVFLKATGTGLGEL